MCTDVGCVRERNEDVAFIDPHGQFFIVADGMGGHAGGDVAARVAVETVTETLDAARAQFAAYARSPSDQGREALCALLRCAVEAGHEAIRERARLEPDKYGMGTTIDVVLVTGDEALIAHAGDSRVYLIRGGRATPITRDHTMAGAMVAAGTYTEEEARVAGLDSVLVNALGCTAEVMVDVVQHELRPGDRLLLCSDGLYDHFSRDELAAHLSPGAAQGALGALIATARDRGGHDNITGVVVDVSARPIAHTLRCAVPPPPVVALIATDPFEILDGPLAALSDEVLGWYVERAIYEEKSGPIAT